MTQCPKYSADKCLQGLGLSLAFQLIVALRVVVGLGEGVALPSMNNLVATLPKSLRSTGLGVAFTGFHSGQYRLQNPTGTQCWTLESSSAERLGLEICDGMQGTCLDWPFLPSSLQSLGGVASSAYLASLGGLS